MTQPEPASRGGNGNKPAGSSRIPVIDALRGVALLGITIANLPYFAKAYDLPPEELAALPTPGCDMLVTTLQEVLISEKFYSLFSLLFGIGIGLQMAAAHSSGVNFSSRHRRRMFWLLVIGAVHSLVWIGDILVLYALIGFVLTAFFRTKPRTLLYWVAALLLMPVVTSGLAGMFPGRGDLMTWFVETGQALSRTCGVPAFVGDRTSLHDHVLGNLSGLIVRYGDLMTTGRPFKVLSLFLLGLYAVRSGLVRNLDRLRPQIFRVACCGLLLGLPGNVLLSLLPDNPDRQMAWNVLRAVLYGVGVVPLCLAYASIVILCFQRMHNGGWLRVFVPTGRMALTNYLLQTVLGVGLFYGIGCGWAGRVGTAPLLFVAGALFATQVLLSGWWLRRFHVGPVEWLWRSLVRGWSGSRHIGTGLHPDSGRGDSCGKRAGQMAAAYAPEHAN